MAYDTIIVETDGRVGTITLNRPDVLNALNLALLGELADVLAVFDKDDQIGCIVLTGNEKAFAAGADIRQMSEQSFVDMFTTDFFTAETEAILRCRKPIIAAVSGYALGGGCELAMMCDFILCSDTAKFGQPEINLGVIAGIGGSQRLTRFAGKSKSMEIHLTGRMMDAEEAERAGLVSRIIPAADLVSEAQKVAAKIAGKSPITTLAVKEAVNRSYETTLREGILFERRLFHSLFATEDQSEGMTAFTEKRKPEFRGK
ncbi:MAG: enoyl-CoA hydratase [Rhodobacteraceae bacterium]|nr:enoyl-CoA hydratase [Paracoccaceae bacterium]